MILKFVPLAQGGNVQFITAVLIKFFKMQILHQIRMIFLIRSSTGMGGVKTYLKACRGLSGEILIDADYQNINFRYE